MVDIRDIGQCEILGHDEFSITVVDGDGGIRYLDREDYPELAAECKYEKVVADLIKDYALDVNKNEYVYVNIFGGFTNRRISPVEVRTKIEDYLITFEDINGEAFIDDLNKEGECTLVSRRRYPGAYNFADLVAGIEMYYIEED
jgi:hypothetical protein